MAKFAILGFGTVGKGVAKVFEMNKDKMEKAIGQELTLQYILHTRNLSDEAYQEKLVLDFSVIENDPEVTVVAECIGGTGAALDYTRRALQAGKHVVTPNKELVATHGKELLALAKARNVNYLFEASVGGGIPVLRPLVTELATNQIEEICGILNGTTNYILHRMVRGGIPFADALKEAQEMGYAERDPSADIDGLDAGRKIAILSDLAFGKEVDPGEISTEGIANIHLKDIDIAAAAGYRIKLLGRSMLLPDGRQYTFVAPHLVPESCPLSMVNDVFNAIMVRGNAVGEVMFYGRGAGSLPTASAVLSDVLDAILHQTERRNINWNQKAELVSGDELPMRWYFRGKFTKAEAESFCGSVEMLSEDAFLTEPLPGQRAKEVKRQLGAKTLLRVL